jgi:hypothetical protein
MNIADFLRGELKKHPSLQKDFQILIKRDLENMGDMALKFELITGHDMNLEDAQKNHYSTIINRFLKYKFLLRENKVSPLGYVLLEDEEFFDNLYKKGSIFPFQNFEQLDDHMMNLINVSQVNQYMKSILREYRKLVNNYTFDIFNALYHGKFSKDYVASKLPKIAGYRDSEALNEALSSILNEKEFSIADIKKQSSNLNTDIVYDNENILILKINDYEASKRLGSNNWCLSYNETYWKHYEKDDYSDIAYNTTFFVYDFKKSIIDPLHLTAFTMRTNGEFVTAHDFNDQYIVDKYIQGEIVDLDEVYTLFYDNVDTVDDLLISKIKENPYSYEYAIDQDAFNVIKVVSNLIQEEIHFDREDVLKEMKQRLVTITSMFSVSSRANFLLKNSPKDVMSDLFSIYEFTNSASVFGDLFIKAVLFSPDKDYKEYMCVNNNRLVVDLLKKEDIRCRLSNSTSPLFALNKDVLSYLQRNPLYDPKRDKELYVLIVRSDISKEDPNAFKMEIRSRMKTDYHRSFAFKELSNLSQSSRSCILDILETDEKFYPHDFQYDMCSKFLTNKVFKEITNKKYPNILKKIKESLSIQEIDPRALRVTGSVVDALSLLIENDFISKEKMEIFLKKIKNKTIKYEFTGKDYLDLKSCSSYKDDMTIDQYFLDLYLQKNSKKYKNMLK